MRTKKQNRMGRLPFADLTIGVSALLAVTFAPALRAAERQVVHGNVQPVLSRLAQTPMSRLDASTRLHLSIGLPLRDPAGMSRTLQELYDPANPRYHQWLQPVEVTAKFGPTVQDYQAVVDWANSKGLTVTAQHPNRIVVEVEGSVRDIETAFGVTMQVYKHPTEARNFFAPDRDPALDLAVKVSTVDGLDSYFIHHSNNHLKPQPAGTAGRGPGQNPTDGSTPSAGTGPGGAYGGCDFRSAYVPGTTLTGVGQYAAVEEFNDYFAVDIANYESEFGLPSVPLVNVVVNGPMPAPGTGNADAEVSLDIELILAMAPGIQNIYVYEAPNSLANDVPLLSRMQSDDICKQISCSWSGGGPNATAEGIFQSMAAQGQSYFNAVGDGDAFTGAIGFPSDSPNVIEVGGTTLTTAGPCGAYTSETAWNWGGGTGTSGGVSTFYNIPWWQQGISMVANQGSTTMRNVPDVALTADNIWVRFADGGSGNFGGTSCAAPLWAGFTALVNQQASAHYRAGVGFLNPALYAMGKSHIYTANFHDVTTGNNFSPSSPTKFAAVTGYDLCTGWGTPAGQAMINYLSGAYGVPNGGFETGDFSLWTTFGSNPDQGVSPSYAHSGNYGAYFGTVGAIGGIYQYLTTEPGQTYVLSFWLENFGGPTNEFAAYCNGYVLDLINVAPFGWTQYQYTITAYSDITLIEFYGRNDPSFFGLDDVTLTPVPGNLGLTGGVPANGGFEAGSFASWTLSGNTGDTYVQNYLPYDHSGTYSAALGPVGPTLGYLTQVVPTVPGQSYLLSYWVDNPYTGTQSNEFNVSWNGTSLFDITDWGTFPWNLFEYTVTATSTSTPLQFGFRNNPAYFYLDDITLTPLVGQQLGEAAYVRSSVGEPWGRTDNINAMNNVFGTGWEAAQFETVDPAVLFSPAVHFIYMDGSDNGALALNTFLNANRATMQSWVSNGGSLFIDAAPNAGGNINLGFGVTLNYNGVGLFSAGNAANLANPIFNGPFTPVGTAWSDGYFAHASVSGAGLVPLIVTNSTILLGEMNVGSGHVLFGGMTLPSFHSPQPQATNLRENMLAYTDVNPQGTFDDLPPSSGLPVPSGYRGVNWNNFYYVDAVDYIGNPSGYGAGVVSPKNVAFNANGAPASITSATPFDFFSAWLTAAWNDNLVLEAKGFANGVLLYDQTYALSATAPTLISFDMLGVTEVDFVSSGGTPHAGYGGSGKQFAMDDVALDLMPAAPSGVDHYSWSVIPASQNVNAPIAVTIVAADINNATVAGFNSQVALSGWSGTTLIEGFESGIWPEAPWVSVGGGGTISPNFTHDGGYGLQDPGWYYRTTPSLGLNGESLRWWVRPYSVTARAYLGFGASAGGCWSVVAEPNTSGFELQTNAGYNYTDIATNYQSWLVGKWYKVEVKFNSTTSITANLYDSDGSTLLNTLSYSGVTGLPGGVAIRSFGFDVDTIQRGSRSPVAVIPNITANFVNGVWSGNVTVLQPEASMYLAANDGIGDATGASNPFGVTLTPPVIQSITHIPGGVSITWTTIPGATYQVQYATSLLAPVTWNNLGSPVTAVGSTASITDTFSGPDRFYRVLMLP